MKSLLLILTAIAWVCSAQAKPFYTTYIVPNGYHGPLIILFHPETGMVLPPPRESWIFTFDAQGRTTVKSPAYVPIPSAQEQMVDYAGPRARYQDEKPIPMEDKASDRDVAFRTVYSVSPGVEKGETANGAVYFFIGTLKEAKQFESDRKTKPEKPAIQTTVGSLPDSQIEFSKAFALLPSKDFSPLQVPPNRTPVELTQIYAEDLIARARKEHLPDDSLQKSLEKHCFDVIPYAAYSLKVQGKPCWLIATKKFTAFYSQPPGKLIHYAVYLIDSGTCKILSSEGCYCF